MKVLKIILAALIFLSFQAQGEDRRGLAVTHENKSVSGKSVALLIGINDYPNAPRLEGPVNDVNALRDVLVERWGFAARDIRTVVNGEATHANILRELSALKQRSAPGDFVFVYFSGHGTSARDNKNNPDLPDTSGAFLPVDFPDNKKLNELASSKRLHEAMIIGRTHLRPVFLALEKDRDVFVVSDSCYSGNLVRSVLKKGGAAHFRYAPLGLNVDLIKPSPSESTQSSKMPEAESYPYKRVVFLSASSDNEPAKDIQAADVGLPTLDGKPHGAFTDALLRVLSGKEAADVDGDGKISYAELYDGVKQFMESRPYGHTPQRLPSIEEDRMQSALAPVFSKGIPSGGLAPVKPVAQVTVRLDATLSQLKGVLKGIAGVRLVGESDPAMLEVRPSDGGVELRAGSGDPIIKYPKANESLMRRISAEVWWRGLVAQAKPDFQVNAETNPAIQGNTFVAGQEFVFNVRSSQQASLLILNINPDGYVSVLYPLNDEQPVQHSAGKLISLPEHEKIKVTPPFGLDQVVVLALPKAPADWHGVKQIIEPVGIDNAQIRGLEKLLSEQGGRFAWQALAVRTYPKLSAP